MTVWLRFFHSFYEFFPALIKSTISGNFWKDEVSLLSCIRSNKTARPLPRVCHWSSRIIFFCWILLCNFLFLDKMLFIYFLRRIHMLCHFWRDSARFFNQNISIVVGCRVLFFLYSFFKSRRYQFLFFLFNSRSCLNLILFFCRNFFKRRRYDCQLIDRFSCWFWLSWRLRSFFTFDFFYFFLFYFNSYSVRSLKLRTWSWLRNVGLRCSYFLNSQLSFLHSPYFNRWRKFIICSFTIIRHPWLRIRIGFASRVLFRSTNFNNLNRFYLLFLLWWFNNFFYLFFFFHLLSMRKIYLFFWFFFDWLLIFYFNFLLRNTLLFFFFILFYFLHFFMTFYFL